MLPWFSLCLEPSKFLVNGSCYYYDNQNGNLESKSQREMYQRSLTKLNNFFQCNQATDLRDTDDSMSKTFISLPTVVECIIIT